MSITSELEGLIRSGVRRIGEISVLENLHGHTLILCHHEDEAQARKPGFGSLQVHCGPAAARDLSTHGADGAYRFAKAQMNLQRGWVIVLANASELRQALDLFYPAAVGLDLARRKGTLEVQHLRDKLGRQTGMYRYAGTISDAGAQALVREVCGPAHQCAKRILWQLDPATPLEDSEASRFNGLPEGHDESSSIPLLCREACNHFVAECRRVAKEEHVKKS